MLLRSISLPESYVTWESYQLQYYSYRWMAVEERYLLKGSMSFREGQMRSIRKNTRRSRIIRGKLFFPRRSDAKHPDKIVT